MVLETWCSCSQSWRHCHHLMARPIGGGIFSGKSGRIRAANMYTSLQKPGKERLDPSMIVWAPRVLCTSLMLPESVLACSRSGLI